jgi:hypothetical protein
VDKQLIEKAVVKKNKKFIENVIVLSLLTYFGQI